MNYRVDNVQKLQDMFLDHVELNEAFLNDPTVHAWFRQFEYGHCTLEEAFIGIVVHLVKEKTSMQKRLIDALDRSMPRLISVDSSGRIKND